MIALVESHDHVCHRYRLRPFASELAAAGVQLEARVLSAGTWTPLTAVVSARRHDIVLLQRRLLARGPLALLRRSARRLIFDFDDAVFHRDSYHPDGIVSLDRARRFASTMRRADVVLAGNRHLAESAIEHGAPRERVVLMPTCIDPKRYFLACHEERRAKTPDLVWIGSGSTLRGLEQQQPLWSTLGRAVRGLRLRLIADRTAAFANVDVIPVRWNEETEAKDLTLGDVGISWMPDDAWSRGKCGLKILQYQAAGLPVIANPVGIHTELVEHGRTGFLADTASDWVEAVRALADPVLRAQMGGAGREAVTRRFSVSAWSATFVSRVLNVPVAGPG